MVRAPAFGEYWTMLAMMLASFGVLITLLLWVVRRAPRRLPPGPGALRFMGLFGQKHADPNVAINGRPYYQNFKDIADEYGNGELFCFCFGSYKALMICSLDAYRDLWNVAGDKITGRRHIGGCKFLNPKKLGLITSEGNRWREQRRFAITTFRDFGMGRGGAEWIIHRELRELIEDLQAHPEPLAPRSHLVKAIGNVVFSIVFSKRLSDHPKCEKLAKELRDSFTAIDHKYLPLHSLLERGTLYIPFDPFGIQRFKAAKDGIYVLMREELKRHREMFDPDNLRDYFDAFLLEEQRNKDNPDSTFTEEQLLESGFELFIGSQETTATSLVWSVFLMAAHPEIQRRVQKEISDVVGPREIRWEDRTELPFTKAVMNEIQRFAAIVPVTGTNVLEPVEWRGWHLPVGTQIGFVEFAVHRDAAAWKDPHHFNPDANFPQNDPKALERAEANMVEFGFGRRICLGESLARQELLLFFGGLLQNFDIVTNPDNPLPQEELSRPGILRSPLPFELCFKKRL